MTVAPLVLPHFDLVAPVRAIADVPPEVSFGMTLAILLLCAGVIGWIFRTGYRLKT